MSDMGPAVVATAIAIAAIIGIGGGFPLGYLVGRYRGRPARSAADGPKGEKG